MKKHSKIAIILPALVLIAFIAALSPLDIKRVHAAGSLSGKTSVEIVSQMGMGWNLGNTFDATGGNTNDIYSQETSWGNPKVTGIRIVLKPLSCTAWISS